LFHCCSTVVPLLFHCCSTVVPLLFHCGSTVVPRLSQVQYLSKLLPSGFKVKLYSHILCTCTFLLGTYLMHMHQLFFRS
jgi:cobalamin biosynthesis Co2+ chelatase CbiK